MQNIISNDETLGKPALSDYKDGKTTLPYIYLYENLNDEDKKILLSYFKKELSSDEILWVKDKFNEFKIIEKCVNEAKFIANEGIEAIEKYKNNELINIMKNMVDRKF